MLQKSDSAFEFHGNWREFAPIAFTNLLLSIVTLGIYVFWARTRERQYLWGQTRFIDERLAWTGTPIELLIGYIMALVLFGLPLALLNFGLQALAIRGYPGIALAIGASLYFVILYLAGVAIFRALRYRLSRTFWRGIRGGSDSQGLRFGLAYFWRTIAGSLCMGLLIPWSMAELWNLRWREMSFGPLQFVAAARFEVLMKRFLLFYLAPIVVIFVAAVAIGFLAATGELSLDKPDPSMAGIAAIIIGIVAYLLIFVVLGLVALVYYAAFFREAIGALRLGGLEFAFTARTRDWFMLALGNLAIVVGTLGVGTIFLGYRNWKFFVTHMEAYGEVFVEDLTQSTTREPGQGEGLLDAFDVGAF